MTTQAERPVQSIAVDSRRRPWSWRALAVAACIVLAGTGVAVGVIAAHGQKANLQPPKAVLGQSIQPLAVYERVTGTQPAHAKAGQMTVPGLGRPGHSTALLTRPVTNLHVQYAHVRPVVGHWQIQFIAPEGGPFNLRSTSGTSFDVLVDGKALTLFFVEGSSDGSNFAIGAEANWLSSAQAVAVARSLTTSVTVAHCSQSAIDANECV
jgi:hypothetical protein